MEGGGGNLLLSCVLLECQCQRSVKSKEFV